MNLVASDERVRPARLSMHDIGRLAFLACTAVAAIAGIGAVPAQTTGDTSVPADPLLAAFRRPASIPAPADNPTTADKVALGKLLFFDPRLSGSGAMSCASCHNPSLGWQDGLATGIGAHGEVLARHTPTILDIAWAEPLFWDGRADTLEEQAKGPLTAPAEMAMPADRLVATVAGTPAYRAALGRIFPGQGVTIETITRAIAAYERTIVSGEAPFDRWVAGDAAALSDSARRGFALFNGKGHCASCHSGWRLTDDGFHDIGLPGDDIGRAKIMPGLIILDHAFKTPTLRNVAERAPYMHDGSIATLEQVIDLYDHGFVRRPSLSDQIAPLGLSAPDKADLLAFLQSLSGKNAPVDYPLLPR